MARRRVHAARCVPPAISPRRRSRRRQELSGTRRGFSTRSSRTRTSIRRGALPSTSATAATPCASRLPAATPLREVGACLRSLPVEENERRRRPHRGGVPAQDLGPRCLVAGAVHGPAPCGLGGPDQGIADDDDARRRRDLPRRRLAEPTDTASRRGAGLRAANRRRAKPSTSADRSDPAKDGREPRGARDLSLRSGD